MDDLDDLDKDGGNNNNELRLETFMGSVNDHDCNKSTLKESDDDLRDKYSKALENSDTKALKSLESVFVKRRGGEVNFDDSLKPFNSNFPNFSDCVDVHSTALQGRFTVAARDIKPGDCRLSTISVQFNSPRRSIKFISR